MVALVGPEVALLAAEMRQLRQPVLEFSPGHLVSQKETWSKNHRCQLMCSNKSYAPAC